MSGSVTQTQLAQSQASVLGPGVASLFIQGIESGLVLAQFSQWFNSCDRIESSLLSTVVVFVTVVGLAQSGTSFASAWSTYVRQFGEFRLPDWSDYLQSVPTLLMSVPVQALMIRRCYYLVGKNLFIITPLVLLLVASIVTSLWTTISIIQYVASIQGKGPNPSAENFGVSWLYLVSTLLPSVLDLVLTGILLHYLTQTMKQVYAPHVRKRISRLADVVWQSALPPTLCTTCLCVVYLQFSAAHRLDLEYWPMIIQATIGKLYVLSLFYMINAQTLGGPPQPDERPTAFISTLTVPTEVLNTLTLDAQVGGVTRSEIAAGRGPSRTVEFAV
ncbi:hypothetical protein V8E53_005673 [Lactarius tabidus]